MTTPALDMGELERRLRLVLVARFGLELGCELTQECLTWVLENPDRFAAIDNPIGYLYRVAQSKARPFVRWRTRTNVEFPADLGVAHQPWIEPGLADALAALSSEQRVAVVLTKCFQWTYDEVAELCDVPMHTVRNRVHRGLKNLRTAMGTE